MTTTTTHSIEYVLDTLPHLQLTNHRGDIVVSHDAGPGEVRIDLHSRHAVDFEPVTSRVDGTTVRVEIPPIRGDGPGISLILGSFSWAAGAAGVAVDVQIHLPSGASIEVETRQGDIDVRGRSGRVAAKTGAGDIQIAEATSVAVHSGMGDVGVGQIGGGSLRTGTGDIRVHQCTQDTEINSGSGDVTVLDSVESLRITTGAGDVNAVLTAGRVDVRSGMGDVTVQVPAGVAVWQDLTTGIGEVRSRVQLHGEPEPGEPFISVTARTGAGDVTLSQ